MTPTTPRTRRQALALGCLLLCAGSGHAESVAGLKDKLGQFTADLAMSATPAAVHVGLSADTVIQPKNRREFEGAVTNLVKDGGKPAGALEFLPYYIVRGGKLPFALYENNGWFRALTKTSLGVAAGTRKIGDAEAEASANGLSLSTVVLDLSDPVHHFGLQQCINDAQAVAIKEAKEVGEGPAEDLIGSRPRSAFTDADIVATPKAVAAYQQCLVDFRSSAQLWNRSRVSFGVAGGNGHESAGAKRKLKYGTAAWATLQYGFEGFGVFRRALFGPAFVDCDNAERPASRADCKPVAEDHWRDKAMFSLHARRLSGASDLDLSQAGDLPTVRSRTLGARFTYGGEKRNFFVEASRLSTHHALNGSTRTKQHAFGASFKIADNLWVNVISGRRQDFTNDQPANVVQIDLAYGLSSDPLVKKP